MCDTVCEWDNEWKPETTETVAILTSSGPQVNYPGAFWVRHFFEHIH